MPGLGDHLLAIPPVTRFFTTVTIATSMALSTELLQVERMLFHIPSEIEAFSTFRRLRALGQDSVWRYLLRVLALSYRIFTSFFIVDGVFLSGAGVLLNIYAFYTFSNYLENSQGRFRGNFPDYLWFILVCGFFLIIINFIFHLTWFSPGSLHSQLLTCITYVWLRSYLNAEIKFLGVVPIKAYYLPLFNFAIAVMSGKSSTADAMAGLLAGYMYQCIQSDTLPFYNLLPGVYGYPPSPANGQRVGVNVQVPHETFQLAVFDLGYWKAPKLFYRMLHYPVNTTARTTAFSKPMPARNARTQEVRSTGYEPPSGATFRGKGHRLGS